MGGERCYFFRVLAHAKSSIRRCYLFAKKEFVQWKMRLNFAALDFVHDIAAFTAPTSKCKKNHTHKLENTYLVHISYERSSLNLPAI